MEMEWVEVQGKTVELAVQVALDELKLSSRDDADIEVVQEAQKGFLGMGGKDAVVRVKAKPPQKKRSRRRRSRGGGGQTKAAESDRSGGSQNRGNGRSKGRSEGRSGRSGGGRDTGKRSRGGESGSGSSKVQESKEDRPQQSRQQRAPRPEAQSAARSREPETVDIEGQVEVVDNFLKELLVAFGLEGAVNTRSEDGVIYADVTGEQTEALVGSRGSIMQAVLELTRTVVQRKSRDSARIRLDIAGYGERRREALRIYAARLADQVLEDGLEVMLEPMNPSDRKVVHDVVAEIEGVRSFSEGEEPNRSVVVGLGPGVEPRTSQDAPAQNAAEDAEASTEPDDEVEDDDAAPEASGDGAEDE